MVFLCSNKEELIDILKEYRPEVEIGTIHYLVDTINNQRRDKEISMLPVHCGIKFFLKQDNLNVPFADIKTLYLKSSGVNIWKLPLFFNNGELLLDAGDVFPQDVIKKINNLSRRTFINNVSIDYKIGLNEKSLKFLEKYIDKKLKLDLIYSDNNIELISLSPYCASVEKFKKKYLLTPIGMLNIPYFNTTSDLRHFLAADINKLLKINVSRGWTDNKLIKLSNLYFKNDMDF